MKKICRQCLNEFDTIKASFSRRICCSRSCSAKYRWKQGHFDNRECNFFRGMIPWNKGKRGLYKNVRRRFLNSILPPHTGHKHSERTKHLISERKKELFKSGKIRIWNKGKEMSEESKLKLSTSKIQYLDIIKGCVICNKEFITKKWNRKCCSVKCWGILNSGPNNINWKNGKSFEEYPKEFRNLRYSIRERDGDRCKICLKTKEELGYNLIVHHIDQNKMNCSPSNLMLMCRKCHLFEHWRIKRGELISLSVL